MGIKFDGVPISEKNHLKVSFDIGGVLSKYPYIFKPMIFALVKGGAEVHVLTDMEKEKALRILAMNDLGPEVIPEMWVHFADFARYGDPCKDLIITRIGIHVHIDDYPGYLAAGDYGVRLMVWPSNQESYYSSEWKTDGSEGEFGRNRPSKI